MLIRIRIRIIYFDKDLDRDYLCVFNLKSVLTFDVS